MTNRMVAQRARYAALDFIDTESVIPKHRLAELRQITARWRAAAREQAAVTKRSKDT